MSVAAAAESPPATTNRPAAPLPGPAIIPEPKSPTPGGPRIRMDEVVVTGTRQETDIRQVPADVSVIAEEQLRKPGVGGFLEAIRLVPGVKIDLRQEGDIGVPGLEVRGLDSNPTSGGNVLILLDGVPQRRLSFGGPYVGGMPYDALTRMELVKGPAAAFYGRGAMAGALQLFTSPGTEAWEVQTWNTFESTVDQAKAAWRVSGPLDAKRGATFSLTGSGTYTDGWQPRTGGAQGNSYLHVRVPLGERDVLSIMGGYFKGQRNVAAPVLIDANGQRLPGIARDQNLSVPGQNALDLDEIRAGLAWDHEWTDQTKSKLILSYWHGDTDWQVARPDDRPAAGTILNRSSSLRPWSEDYFFSELQASHDYTLAEQLTGSVVGGGNLEYSTWHSRLQSIWSPGSTAAQGIQLDLATMVEPDPSTWIYGPWGERDTSEFDPGVFLKNHLNIGERVNLDAGLRFDSFERHQQNLVTGAASTVRGSAISPSVGLAVHLLKDAPHLLTAYASWGRGFNPVYRSVGTTEIVNLDPETSQSYEFGLKSTLWDGKVEGTLAFYQQERNDVVGNIGATITTNVGDWTIQGVEVGLRAQPVKGWTLHGSFTHRLPEVERDLSNPNFEGKRIPFTAADMFTLGAEYAHRCGLFAGLDDQFVGPSFADSLNTVHLNNYHLMSAHAGYRWKQAEVAVFIRNLLDEEYFSAVFLGVRNGSAFEGTPRSVGVSFSAKF